MKNEKGPGIDGFPADIHTNFWNEMKYMLLESYKYSKTYHI